MENLIYSNRAAECFEEAFPIGNGRIGAMVYGKGKTEEISLNHDTLWSGYPKEKNRVGAYKSLGGIRTMIDGKRLEEAKKEIHKEFLSDFTESYQPAGKLMIKLFGVLGDTEVKRRLFLDSALCETVVNIDGLKIKRQQFCAYDKDIMVTRLVSDKPFEAGIEHFSPHPFKLLFKDGVLALTSNLPAVVEPSYFECESPVVYGTNGEKGMAYAIASKIKLKNGSLFQLGDEIIIRDCTEALLITGIETGFLGYDKMPETDPNVLLDMLLKKLEEAAEYEYEELFSRHFKEWSRLYNTASISLVETGGGEISIKERIENAEKNGDVAGLVELLFNYGRYLLISSSRKDTQPANLQGIWNETIRPPWSSNYTININTQMNYWPAESCGLHECHIPLIKMLSELCENGKKTAREQYNMRGWVAHHNTDLWRQTAPVGGRQENPVIYAFWPLGGAWMSLHLTQMWEFCKDEDLLKEAYPIVKGAAEFLLDYLCEDSEGNLVSSPSTSPENPFIYNGESYPAYKLCTMDIAIIKQLFSDVINMSKVLKTDEKLSDELKSALEKIPDYRIATDGRLAEWFEDFEETDVHHRHVSHLLGLYPGNTINSDELKVACRQSMIARGDEGTGWSLAWKACLWAALGDGNSAYRLISRMLKLTDLSNKLSVHGGGVYENLLCAHPPFQIDGNFGITAAIASLLVQSDIENLYILPALPDALPVGKAKGLCAKNGLVVDLEWKDATLSNILIHANADAEFNLHTNKSVRRIKLCKGENISI